MTKGFASRTTILASIILLLLVNAGQLSAAVGIYGDVSIIGQDESSITFRYTVGDTSWITDEQSGTRVLHVDGCENSESEGMASVPIKSILLGVPFNSSLDYEIINASWSDDFPLGYTTANKNLNQRDIIRTGRPAKIRSQNTRALNIYPLAVNGKSARLLRDITITVKFRDNGAGISTKQTGFNSEGGFEKIYSGMLLNYSQASKWRQPVSEKIALQSRDNVFGKYSDWVKLDFSQTGLQMITAQDLTDAGIQLSSVDPRNFRIFWAGGRPLPEDADAAIPELHEIAIYVNGELDGSFDQNDYILLYLPGPNFYEYDTDSANLEYVENSYSRVSCAFLSMGTGSTDPLRMQEQVVTPRTAATSVFSFRDKKRYEQNQFLSDVGGIIFDYFRWYWKEGATFDQFINVDDVSGVSTFSRLNVRVLGRSPSVQINGIAPDSSNIVDGPNISYASFWSDAFSSGLNTLQMTINGNIRNDRILDFLELEYQRRMVYRGGTFTFYGKNDPDTYAYRIIGDMHADSTYFLCDASDIYNQKFLTVPAIDEANGYIEFEYTQELPGFRRFALAEKNAVGSPSKIESINVADILNPGQSYDEIVIAPRDFLPAFGAYRSLRNANGHNIYLAAVEDVYAQFSGGMLDPVAIRDFLSYAYHEWPQPAPSFVILGGDGNYDFLNHTGIDKKNYIPPYIAASDSTASDENYILFDNTGYLDSDSSYPGDIGPDMVIARWPVRSGSEVADYVAKLAGYDSDANMGSWQNNMTYVADDENKPGVEYKETVHTEQAENLANFHTPDRFDKNKIYLIEYPLDSRGEKPEVKRKIIEAINNGTLLVNFVGHGNPHLWTDERVFRNEDIPSLNNEDKLMVVVAASCSIGEFDSPYDEGMAELFLRYTDGGAIGVVATTRLVYSGPNATFNYQLFDVLFSGQDYTLAESVYIAKFIRQMASGIIENDRKFIMFGDPLMKLAEPHYGVAFNEDNIDSLAALNLITVDGEVQDANGALVSGFNGTVTVSAFDNQQNKIYQITTDQTSYDLHYTMPGARIFKGETDVSGGKFSLQFIVPKDISYGGEDARISAYAQSSSDAVSASGSVDSIVVSGTVAEIDDSISPEIQIYSGENELIEGTVLPQESLLRIVLFDSTGINLSGEVGHKFEVSLDDDPFYTFDLTDHFVYYPGSYQNGEAEIRLPEIENGNYVLKIKAWDSANNSALKEIRISIGAAEAPQIVELFNVPNPFADETQFYYELSEDASDVSIDIFTLAGRKIHTIGNLPGHSGENISSMWNGADKWGDKLANGVYIYKLSVRAAMGSTDNIDLEKFGKLVILK